MQNIVKITILLIAVSMSNVAFCAPVSVEKAKTEAFNFLKTVDSRISSSSLEVVYARENAFYIYGYASGWVIVYADDRVMPILGYSTEGVFITPQSAEDTTIRGTNF